MGILWSRPGLQVWRLPSPDACPSRTITGDRRATYSEVGHGLRDAGPPLRPPRRHLARVCGSRPTETFLAAMGLSGGCERCPRRIPAGIASLLDALPLHVSDLSENSHNQLSHPSSDCP